MVVVVSALFVAILDAAITGSAVIAYAALQWRWTRDGKTSYMCSESEHSFTTLAVTWKATVAIAAWLGAVQNISATDAIVIWKLGCATGSPPASLFVERRPSFERQHRGSRVQGL